MRFILGEGIFGTVWLATETNTGQKAALKYIKLVRVNNKSSLEKEMNILEKLNHESIIRLQSKGRIGSEGMYLMLELAENGELADRIEPDIGMPKQEAFRFFRQLLNGVEYLHSRNIVHRDLKPENLLVNKNLNLKISNFGTSAVFMKGDYECTFSDCAGTALFLLPELLRGEFVDAPPIDLWACGVILVQMLTGAEPWDRAHPGREQV